VKSLHIDIESYSPVPIKAGVYRYAEEAEIILFAYAFDNDPVEVIDLLDLEEIPHEVMQALTDPYVVKKAFNAAFERAVMQAYFNMKLPADQWECTQARTAMCGLPLNLEQAAMVLNVNHQKQIGGKALINFFCIPVKKPIKKNEFRTRNYPQHAPDKWQQFKIYNAADVEAERAVCRALSFYQISPFEHRQWCLDQKINETGVGINVPFVRSAIQLINHYEESLLQEFMDITGIEKPSQLGLLKKWLFEETGEEVDKLNKETIPDIIASTDSNRVLRALEIRKESSKTSTKKYPTMMLALCRDGRVRGLHEYYGANRTGRAAGRLLQHQNLPRGDASHSNIEPIRELVLKNDPEWLEFCYGAIPNVLSSLIRSTLIPAPGHRFIISDFSAVEARGLAWLAGEKWVLDVFRTHGKIYEATASRMFSLPLEKIKKDSPYRQKGKVAALALGYQGSVGALVKMGALREGISEDELPAMVSDWRKANPNIVKFWKALQEAAVKAVSSGQRVPLSSVYVDGYTAPERGIEFYMRGRSMFLKLPSGRELVYASAQLEQGEFGEKITYWGIDQVKKKWTKLDTYGGKLAENVTQALCRDLLMSGLQNLDRAGYKIVLHVHDESVLEMPIGVGSLEEVNRLMTILPDWAEGFPLKAEGCESFYYKK
jgi:DNA polymerase bacteriophage-type